MNHTFVVDVFPLPYHVIIRQSVSHLCMSKIHVHVVTRIFTFLAVYLDHNNFDRSRTVTVYLCDRSRTATVEGTVDRVL